MRTDHGVAASYLLATQQSPHQGRARGGNCSVVEAVPERVVARSNRSCLSKRSVRRGTCWITPGTLLYQTHHQAQGHRQTQEHPATPTGRAPPVFLLLASCFLLPAASYWLP